MFVWASTGNDYALHIRACAQAIEIRPPGLPYKPMVFTLYNALAGFSFAQVRPTLIYT